MNTISITAGLAALAVLAACTEEETEALINDPNAFSCRERAVGAARVDFAETSAQPINTDITGTSHYNVFVGETTYRCTLDSDGDIIDFFAI